MPQVAGDGLRWWPRRLSWQTEAVLGAPEAGEQPEGGRQPWEGSEAQPRSAVASEGAAGASRGGGGRGCRVETRCPLVAPNRPKQGRKTENQGSHGKSPGGRRWPANGAVFAADIRCITGVDQPIEKRNRKAEEGDGEARAKTEDEEEEQGKATAEGLLPLCCREKEGIYIYILQLLLGVVSFFAWWCCVSLFHRHDTSSLPASHNHPPFSFHLIWPRSFNSRCQNIMLTTCLSCIILIFIAFIIIIIVLLSLLLLLLLLLLLGL